MSMTGLHPAFERQGVGWQEHRKDGTWDWKLFGFYCFESGYGNISRKSWYLFYCIYIVGGQVTRSGSIKHAESLVGI